MADGKVIIDVNLDTSGVTSGIKSIDSQISGIKTSGLEAVGETADDAGGRGERSGAAIGESFQTAGKKMSAVGGIMSASVTVPLVALGKSAFTTAAEFDQVMLSLQAMTGTGAEEMEQMRQYAVKMGADTVFSAKDAADAMFELSKAGITNEEIMGGVLETTMKCATVGELPLAEASTIVTNAMHQFGLEADNTDQIVTALASVANASTSSVQSLGEGLGNCGNMASQVGWSMQDTVSVLGLLSDRGIDGAEAGTQLRSMFMRLLNPVGEGADAIAEYNLQFRNADGTMKDAAGIAQELQDKLGGVKKATQDTALAQIFGSYAMQSASALMHGGAESVQKYNEAAYDAKSTQDLFTAQMTGSKGAMEQLSGSIETAALAIGEALTPVVLDVAGALNSLADWFSGLDEGTQQLIVRIGIFVAALGPVVLVLGLFAAGIGKIISVGSKVCGTLSSVDRAIGSIGGRATQAAGGLGSIGSKASATGAAASSSAKNLLALGAAVLMIGGGVALVAVGFRVMADAAIALSAAGTPAIIMFAAMMGAVALLVVVVALLGDKLLVGAIAFAVFGAGMALVGVGILAICAGIRLVLDGVTNLINTLPTIEEHAAGAGESMKSAMYSVADGIKQVITQLGEAIGSFLSSVGQGFADFANSVASGFFQLASALAAVAFPAGAAALALGALAFALGGFDLACGGLDLVLSGFAGSVWLVTRAFEGLSPVLESLGGAVSVLGDGVRNLGGGFQAVGDGVSTIAANGFNAALALGEITAACGLLSPALWTAGNNVEGFASSLWKMRDAERDAGGSARELLSSLPSLTGAVASLHTAELSAATATGTLASALGGSVLYGIQQLASAFSSVPNSAEAAAAQVQSCIWRMEQAVSSARLVIPYIEVGELPHFYLRGSFDPQTGSVPVVGVQYYAKGGIVSKPTLGVFGEAGAEANIPLSGAAKMRPFAEAIAQQMPGDGGIDYGRLAACVAAAMQNVAVNIDSKKVANLTVAANDTALGNRQRLSARGVAI